MAITQGAKKAHRSSLRKQEFNLRRKGKVSRAIKSLKKLIASGKNLPAGRQGKEAIQKAFREVQSALDKAVKAKTLKKNTAARKKSRLSKLIKKL
ncbi:MAG: 30S ribosomal protein S20 [Patescibacteria group bacterium]